MLCSTLVTFCALNITFYQRTLLGTSANQKRHYLKSYNNYQYQISGQARGHISNCPINEESTKDIENTVVKPVLRGHHLDK